MCESNLWGIETDYISFLPNTNPRCESNLWGLETRIPDINQNAFFNVWIVPVRDWNERETETPYRGWDLYWILINFDDFGTIDYERVLLNKNAFLFSGKFT